MTILSIRTDQPTAEIALFEDHSRVGHASWEAHRILAETLHQQINDMLESVGKQWPALEGIIAYEGPGSFTGLRIGITVANTLAYSLNIPIVAQAGKEWEQAGVQRLLRGENARQIVPVYGGDPHITQPRH